MTFLKKIFDENFQIFGKFSDFFSSDCRVLYGAIIRTFDI